MKIPTRGRIVIYRLTDDDATAINQRRRDAQVSAIADRRSGAIVHIGDEVYGTWVYPMIVVNVWQGADGHRIGGQVLLAGNDTLWVDLVDQGPGNGCYEWPTIA